MADQNKIDFTVRISGDNVDGLTASVQKLDRGLATFDATVNGLAGDSATTAQALEQAFKILGVKSVQSVEQEVKQLQAALAQIRSAPDVLPADKAAAVQAFNQRLAQLRGEAQQVPPALGRIDPAADRTGEALAGAARKAIAWTAALAGIGSAADVGRQLIETGSQFENLRVRLDNLLGGTQKAEAAFDMIKTLAATTPFEVTALTESFVKLTAFGLQPTEAQMRALSDVAANLGGGTETLAGVTLALGQAWAKGKLQGEEIMQLAERGVPVWDALARATGRSIPELQRMSEAGALGRDVISKLIDELGRMNAGASDKLMHTYAGAVSNAKDALADFFDMVSRSGVLDFLTGKVQELLTEFDRMKASGELQAKAKAIADTFVQMASAVDLVVKALVQFGPQIKLLVEGAIALKAANMGATLLGIAGSAAAAATATTAAGVASATTAGQMEVATVAGGRMATMLRLLRSLSGVGLVLGVAELAQEFLRAKSAAEQGDAAVKKMLETPTASNKPKEAAQAITNEMELAGKRADDLLAEFTKLMEGGAAADEAISQIGKKFDLASAPGIKTAAAVLDTLVSQGKISATQFQDEWSKALKGVDLLAFEQRARQAMTGTQDDAKRLAQVLDQGLREAIRRAGGDFAVISGGMGKAAQSAVNDVSFIADHLQQLKAKGVDVGQALALSIGKAIDTADSQKALDAVRAQIEAVRKVLGDKVADGFLDQAKQKALDLKDALDKATPGINSVREAMKQLGIASDETLRNTATQSKAAYDTLVQSGKASARELSLAFKKTAEDAIAANGGIAPSWVQAEASARGYELQVDSAGKATIKAAGEAAKAVDDLAGAHKKTAEQIKAEQEALDRLNMSQKLTSDYNEREIALLEKDIALQERRDALERKRQNVDKNGFALDKSGNTLVAGGDLTTMTGIAAFLKAAGVNDDQVARNIAREFADSKGDIPYFSNPGQIKYGGANSTMSQALLKAAERYTFAGAPIGGTGSAPQSTIPQQTRTVNINFNGAALGAVRTDAAGDAVLQRLMDELARAKAAAA